MPKLLDLQDELLCLIASNLARNATSLENLALATPRFRHIARNHIDEILDRRRCILEDICKELAPVFKELDKRSLVERLDNLGYSLRGRGVYPGSKEYVKRYGPSFTTVTVSASFPEGSLQFETTFLHTANGHVPYFIGCKRGGHPFSCYVSIHDASQLRLPVSWVDTVMSTLT